MAHFSRDRAVSSRKPAPWGGVPQLRLALQPWTCPHPHCPFPLPLCRSGLGYVLGSAVLQLTGNWRWGFRVSPTSLLPSNPPGLAGTFQPPVALATWHGRWRHGGCQTLAASDIRWNMTVEVTALGADAGCWVY